MAGNDITIGTTVMRYQIIPVTHYQQNCSLIWCEQTRNAALIDPGGEAERLLQTVEEKALQLKMVLLTHGHLDHVGAANAISQQCQIPVVGPHEADLFLLSSLPQQSQHFGFPHTDNFTPMRWLQDGESIELGELLLEVLHTPGHTPGHVCFFHRESATAFVGDVLFQGSIGRTDFPQGDMNSLLLSIKERLLPLGDEVVVVPGHGPTTTIGNERQYNPYIR